MKAAMILNTTIAMPIWIQKRVQFMGRRGAVPRGSVVDARARAAGVDAESLLVFMRAVSFTIGQTPKRTPRAPHAPRPSPGHY